MGSYFIDSIEVRIYDEDTEEIHILSLNPDAGENGFIRTKPTPTPLDEELTKKIDAIWDIAFK
jgi:hypothetical protein